MDLWEKSMKIFVMFDAFLLEYDIYLKFQSENIGKNAFWIGDSISLVSSASVWPSRFILSF